ncbi:MAG: hypothetical protein PVJ71_07730 [Lysobacterales bacterium]|jgi:OOP family OmpA-OmpF porin
MSDRPKTPPSDADDLRRLRELLLGDHIEQIDSVSERVQNPEMRTGDVAEVLPGAMDRIIADPVTKPRIEKPMVDTIRGAIKRDTESFAEALFPVLGPAIRRAVADALKSLVQRVNSAIEHSFSIKGLRWRLEAARSGVPFGQIVLRETMLYVVQEVFLIQPGSGLVLAKVRRADMLTLDEDAFSAMLTAIQSFIQDSMGMEDGEKLRSAELGDRTVWLIDGPRAVLACLVVGSPPLEVREHLRETLEAVHAQFADELDLPPDQLSNQSGIEALLETALRGEMAESDKRSSPWLTFLPWVVAGALLLAFLSWTGWKNLQLHRQEAAVASLFDAEPGYVLTAHDSGSGEIRLHGLRDPLSRPPVAVLAESGHDTDNITAVFRPYLSLDDAFVLRRLRESLDIGNADLQLEGAALTVNGSLTPSQRSSLAKLPGLHPVIDTVDLSGTRLEAAAAAALAHRELNAPTDVEITPAEDRLLVTGSNAAWYAAVAPRIRPIGGWPLDFSPLRASVIDALDERLDAVNGQSLMFTRLSELAAGESGKLEELSRELTEIQELAAIVDQGIQVSLLGYADGTGQRERNIEIAAMRAGMVLDALVGAGLDPAIITTSGCDWQSGERDPALRKVVLQVGRDRSQ